MKINIREIILFGKILSAGLVIAGYVFLGVWLCNWLINNGFSVSVALLAVLLIIIFGLWQGWLFVSKKILPSRNDPEAKN
ncbi:MAG: hypothetical protein IJP48_00100 [Synergistaceae bacterium]|nr:hypothetical protein [Synergistaceae bacterium]